MCPWVEEDSLPLFYFLTSSTFLFCSCFDFAFLSFLLSPLFISFYIFFVLQFCTFEQNICRLMAERNREKSRQSGHSSIEGTNLKVSIERKQMHVLKKLDLIECITGRIVTKNRIAWKWQRLSENCSSDCYNSYRQHLVPNLA